MARFTAALSVRAPAGTATVVCWSKVTRPKRSWGSSWSTSAVSAALACVQPGSGHRPAAVEHDDQGARGTVDVGRLLGGGQLDQHGQLVVGLVGEDVQIEMSGEMHGGRPVCRERASAPVGAAVLPA